MTTIAILTDFGLQDPFVGIMKGVMAGIAPQAQLIDISHQIPAGNIHHAAISLWQAAAFFPDHTVFLCVVDPGVGTERRPIVLDANGKRFVGPDNGLFTYVASAKDKAWVLDNSRYQLTAGSATFHGRDIFSPAAAHLAAGIPAEAFGPSITPMRLKPPRMQRIDARHWQGEILYADHFGNLLTSLGLFSRLNQRDLLWRGPLGGDTAQRRSLGVDWTAARLALQDGSILKTAETFAHIPAGRCAGLIGSTGLVELAANAGSANNLLNINAGDPITLNFGPNTP